MGFPETEPVLYNLPGVIKVVNEKRTVYIVEGEKDADNPGRSHMMNIAKELKGIARSVKMLELPVPEKQDVSYYLEEGHTIEELLNLVRNTVYAGESIRGENFSLLNYHFSDVGNAERLIALYGRAA